MPAVSRRKPSARTTVALVAGITVAGLLLRLPSFGNSLFGDEVGSYYIVTGHSLGRIVHILDGHSVDLTPPLYYLLSRVVERFANSPQMLRLVPLLSGVAAIPLTYVLGLRTVGRLAALTAAALVALSPFLVFYSTEARAYALVMVLVLASTLALLKALEGAGSGWWAAYAFLSCAAMYAHYTAVFVLGAQLIWALLRYPSACLKLVGANLVAAIGFLPWLPTLLKNRRSFGTKVFGVLEPFDLHAVAHDLAHWSIGHPYIPLTSVPGSAAIVMVLAGVAAACAGWGATLPGRVTRRRGSGTLARLGTPAGLPVLLAVAAPAGLAIYSTLGDSVWDMRNLITSWPALAVVGGGVLTSAKRPIRLLAVSLVAGGLAIGALKLLRPSDQRPDYAAAAEFVIRNGTPADAIAVVPAPTPGPLAAVDAALAYAGDRGRQLLRVGSPSLESVLRAPPYAFLPATPTAALVRQAACVGPNGKLFVSAPGTAGLSTLLGTGNVDARAALGPVFGSGTSGRVFATVFGPLSSFLKAVSHQFRPLGTRTFPGFLRLSVYVLARRSSGLAPSAETSPIGACGLRRERRNSG